MPSITDTVDDPIKLLEIGKSGSGKTGSLASLVAEGYNLRILDTDKGVRALRNLLIDPRYPYKALIDKRGIDLPKAVHYIPIDTAMGLKTVQHKVGDRFTSESVLGPKSAGAWNKVIKALENWQEKDADGKVVVDYGGIYTWTNKEVLVVDSFSTLAKCAYYHMQGLNNRLGARDDGFDYQRDVGGAQSQLTRFLEFMYDGAVKCNVVIISHITWVDETRGIAARPKTEEQSKDAEYSSPDGYPSAIGRALSPQMGKYFNDVVIVREVGSRREISTVSADGVLAKNSSFVKSRYPIGSGMAELFAAMKNQPEPKELMEAMRGK